MKFMISFKVDRWL